MLNKNTKDSDMPLAPHQEQLLIETHAVTLTTKKLLEIHMEDLEAAKNRVTVLERKLDRFMGAWLILTSIAGALFAWLLKTGEI
jgi:hypothetical protein